jgi:hypothetical protein
MNAEGKLLAQIRPSGTTAVQAYQSPPAAASKGLRTEIMTIFVCNTTGSAVNFSLYHHDSGTTYNQTTALYYSVSLAANTTQKIECQTANGGLAIKPGGTLGVQSSTADALNFSVYGVTQQLAVRV